jgi:hypothetical protein
MKPEQFFTLGINWVDRWSVYQRLQQLHIDCQCGCNQPLEVKFNSPTEILQMWSVIRQQTACRNELIAWLEYCWQL